MTSLPIAQAPAHVSGNTADDFNAAISQNMRFALPSMAKFRSKPTPLTPSVEPDIVPISAQTTGQSTPENPPPPPLDRKTKNKRKIMLGVAAGLTLATIGAIVGTIAHTASSGTREDPANPVK